MARNQSEHCGHKNEKFLQELSIETLNHQHYGIHIVLILISCIYEKLYVFVTVHLQGESRSNDKHRHEQQDSQKEE